MSERLFVYGTLHPDRAPAEIAEVVRQLRPVGAGAVRGRLFDLGEYPGLVPDDSAYPVRGHVFAVPDTEMWRRLDAYEGFQLGDEAASLFVRRLVMVAMDDGWVLECWVYEYNRSRLGG